MYVGLNELVSEEIQTITLQYLETFLASQFSISIVYIYHGMDGQVTDVGTGRADFSVDAIFDSESFQLPSQAELNLLISTAFGMPFVVDLLDMLPSVVTDVQYIPL